MSKILRSRTIWLAIAQGSVAGMMVTFTELDMVGWVIFLKSIADVLLRLDTTEPIT